VLEQVFNDEEELPRTINYINMSKIINLTIVRASDCEVGHD
jgi:hypothetical protein